MSATDKIKLKSYRNWVRGALGLSFVQEGLHPFTDRVVQAEHARIVQNLTSCTNCAIEKIRPNHAGSGKCIQNNSTKCNCNKKKANRTCATCSNVYDEIVLQHRFKDPNWTTDCSTWYNDHWQFAKCFLTTTTKGSNNTAAETDASGLLSIIINGEFFQPTLQCIIDPPNDDFSQVRKIRNEILHNSTLNLSDQEVTSYLQSMKAVLEDGDTLSSDPAAKAAAEKLNKLLNTDLNITTDEEARAIQTALNYIKEAKEQSEESIRKLTQHRTEEINATAERAKGEVASTVSTVFKETYEPEVKRIKLGHEDHENRIRTLEEQMVKLGKEVATMKNTEEMLQKRAKYLEQKQLEDLQQHLVEKYQKEDVKASISPLMTQQNNVNINDVYALPKMEGKENDKDENTTEAGKDRGTKSKPIEKYCEIFGTAGKRNRKIFIVGDVGTGKSSICKMMMQNWCSSITNRRNSDDSDAKDEEGVAKEKENDTYVMNRFDFLFYVPLREMPEDTDDPVDMIKDRLKKYRDLIDGIFKYNSERVLILADGLDELKPSKSRSSQWIPKSSLALDSTILTTSRPSSDGILKMKSSDYDLKVTLLGLKDKNSMIENYMELLDKISDVKAFKKVFSNLPFKDIENAPMLLQQIIWLYCNKYDIGKSRTSVYIHIVNAILGWEYERHGHNPKLKTSVDKYPRCHKNQELLLPKPFDKFCRCQENKELLLILGKIAHDAYITGNNSSLVFGRYKLNQLDVSDEDIGTIVQTGILTEINCADPTDKKSQLSFIHTSYVEFFAALYICSSYLSESSDSPSSNPFTILERLIAVTPETSVTEILRLENVLIMICGLDPRLTEHVCDCIYKLTPSDENTDENIIHQIHDLTEDCLSEHNSVDQKTVVKFKLRHICKLYAFDRGLSMRVSDLVPTSVETCSLVYLSLSHEQCLSLESCLSQAVSIRTLKVENITCTKDDCEGHAIDLTDHNELKSINLSRNKISVAGINHTCLQSYRISDCKLSHEQCSLLSSCLSQAVSLRTLEIEDIKCTEDECEGHTIELTNHKELQSIKLSGNKMSVSGINHTCLQSYRISGCKLSHEQYSLLSSCLSQAVSLRTLEIKDIKCTEDECEGHTIYMTNHKELQSITITGCKTSVSGIKSTVLETCILSGCRLSHEQCTALSSCLSQATLLKRLKLYKVKCIKPECEGHCIDLSSQNQLRDISVSSCDIITLSEVNQTCLTNHKQLLGSHLSTCNTIFITGINPTCLKECDISNCDLSHEQCASLCSFLSQAESLNMLVLSQIKCIEDACEGHYIDLTIKWLHTLDVSYCNMISITGFSPDTV